VAVTLIAMLFIAVFIGLLTKLPVRFTNEFTGEDTDD
jgi:hypothetical protein